MSCSFWIYLCALISVLLSDYRFVQASHAPIVFLPGIGGSRILYKHNPPFCGPGSCDPHGLPLNNCPVHKDWHKLWLDVWTFLKGDLECWVADMKLKYDLLTKRSDTVPGVTTKVPGWGNTTTIERLDPSLTNWMLGDVSVYAAPFIEKLVQLGYVRGKSVRGAPYDFRFAPHSQSRYFRRLKDLIMDTYRVNNNTRVALVGHSMGGLYAHYFLTRMPQQWKDEYIHSLSTLSSPWYGTAILPRLFVSGYAWGTSIITPLKIREQQVTHESSVYLLPRQGGFNPDTTLIVTPKRNYTLNDYQQFFEDLNLPVVNDMLRTVLIKDYGRRWTHPGVDFYCIFSSGVDTMQTMYYDSDIDTHRPPYHVKMGDGDGTVNIKSLRGCGDFLRNHEHHLKYRMWTRQLTGFDHDNIIDSDETIQLLLDQLVDTSDDSRGIYSHETSDDHGK